MLDSISSFLVCDSILHDHLLLGYGMSPIKLNFHLTCHGLNVVIEYLCNILAVHTAQPCQHEIVKFLINATKVFEMHHTLFCINLISWTQWLL